MRPALVVLVFALAGAAAPPAAAQPGALPSCEPSLAQVRAATTERARRDAATELVKMNLHPDCLAEVIALSAVEQASFARFLKMFESVRTDKQAGSGAGSGGTTNLVSKGMTARILSLAAEYGALTSSVSKQIVTLQGSLDAVPALLVRHNLLPYCPAGDRSSQCAHSGAFDLLRRFSYGVSFDTSQDAQTVTAAPRGDAQGGAQPVTFEASGHTLAGVSGRAIVWNARDASSSAFQGKWVNSLQATTAAAPIRTAAAALLDAMTALLDQVETNPAYLQWQNDTVAALAAASTPQQIDPAWLARARALGQTLGGSNPDVFDRAAQFLRSLAVYRFEEDDLVAALANKPVVAVEYAYRRTTGEPTSSSVRVMFDKGLGRRWSVAFNGAVGFYNQRPPDTVPGSRQLRDAQGAVQLQRDIGTLSFLGAAAIAGSYYYQYQFSPAILEVTPGTSIPGISFAGLPPGATDVFAEKGVIHVAQLRLVLGPAESSARFPVSVSWASRTELITRPVFRAQIGVSYDFDSLFAR
jgi:hypothetical protein